MIPKCFLPQRAPIFWVFCTAELWKTMGKCMLFVLSTSTREEIAKPQHRDPGELSAPKTQTWAFSISLPLQRHFEPHIFLHRAFMHRLQPPHPPRGGESHPNLCHKVLSATVPQDYRKILGEANPRALHGAPLTYTCASAAAGGRTLNSCRSPGVGTGGAGRRRAGTAQPSESSLGKQKTAK